jgi:hypothetical protein
VPTPTVTLSYIVGPYPNRPDNAGCATTAPFGSTRPRSPSFLVERGELADEN